MSVKITYFVHGTTTDNEEHISSGWNDVDLSNLGIRQSEELSTMRPDKFDAIFCSDLTRAIHSANLFFQDKFPIIIDSRLRECNYGDYNGASSENVKPLMKAMITKSFPKGESYEDVRSRIESFLSDLKRNYEGKHIAIVAHQAPQLALNVLLRGMSWSEAIDTDWRKTGAWQPGWEYTLS